MTHLQPSVVDLMQTNKEHLCRTRYSTKPITLIQLEGRKMSINSGCDDHVTSVSDGSMNDHVAF